jgi:Mn2+/Fe2+ NRAMP family transporter
LTTVKTRRPGQGRQHPDDPAKGDGGRDRLARGGARSRAKPVKKFLKVLGPGLVTGASDDDPSGVGTSAVAGASLGFATLWLALFTFPLMAAVQFTCAKIGMVTGSGLAGVLRQHYPRPLLYAAVVGLMVANTINAGADIGAIAAAINLLVPIPIVVLIVPIALSIVVLQVWGSYRLIANTFKWLALALLAYVGAALFARPDPLQVLRGTFVPTLSPGQDVPLDLGRNSRHHHLAVPVLLANRPGGGGGGDPDGSCHFAGAQRGD